MEWLLLRVRIHPASVESIVRLQEFSMRSTVAFVVIGLGIAAVWILLLLQGGLLIRSFAATVGVVGGPFAIAGAIFNWEWFFADEAARPLVDRYGRTGARLYYIVVGVVLAG